MEEYIDHLLVLVVMCVLILCILFDRKCIFIIDGFPKHTKTASIKDVLPQSYLHVQY